MKNTLHTAVTILFYSLLWCRETLLEASEVCQRYDPAGCSDYTDFPSCSHSLSCCGSPRKESCSSGWVSRPDR